MDCLVLHKVKAYRSHRRNFYWATIGPLVGISTLDFGNVWQYVMHPCVDHHGAITLFRAGSERFDSGRGGGGYSAPRQISKTKHRSDKRQMALDGSVKDLQLVHTTFSGQINIEVTRGHLQLNV